MMTDDKRPKTGFPPAESFSAPEAAGYLFKIIHEGWLRKRWRKRYCVLSNGTLYFYEFKTSDGTEKTCSSLNLKLFGECMNAPKKECKKSLNTFILEPAKAKNDSKDAAKKNRQIQREFLYTDTAEEREKWVAKLQEAISITSIGGNVQLTHVTKTRARPPRGGNRRPPTKQHLRERAIMSEVALEDTKEEAKENGSTKARGHKPTNALKPAPGMKPKMPKASLKPKINNNENEEKLAEQEEDTTLDLPSPPPTPKSPTPPPAALKPPSTKRMVVSVTNSPNGSEEEGSPSRSTGNEADNEEDKLPTSTNSSIRINERPLSEHSNESSNSSIGDATATKQSLPEIENSYDEEEANTINEDESSSPIQDKDDSPTKTSPLKSSPKIQKLMDQLDIDFSNGILKSDDRMMKAKSMVALDIDLDLPPPPSPPPDSNEDSKKKDEKKNKKGKKKKKSRPSSLILVV